MKRVVQLIASLGPGGAEEQVRQLSTRLCHRSWGVEIVSLVALDSAFATEPRRDGGLPLALSAPPRLGCEKCSAVPVHSLEMRPGVPDPRGLAHLAGILRRLRPAVLHSHMFHANVMARAVRLLCPAPALVSTLHSVAELRRHRPGSGGREERRWRPRPESSLPLTAGANAHAAPETPAPVFRDLIYRLTDPMADVVVAVSDAVAERHARDGAARRRKLRVIPNGVDTSVFRPDAELRARTRRELGLNSQFVWLAAGRLMWKKDYPTLLRAFAARPRGTLLIAGQGPLEAELKKLAEGLGVDARFLGQAGDMPALMNAADAVASSSVIEGLPMALLEAAACGLPAVATDAGGVRDIVVDGATGYVAPPGGAAKLTAAISRVEAMSTAERAAMSRAARARVVARFDMDAVAAQWEALYSELLEGGSPWL